MDRRQALGAAAGLVLGTVVMTGAPHRTDAATMDTDAFLSSGGVAMPMGVSGQAGKSKPITNVVFPDGGLDVQRDPKTGNVLAEILVQKSKQPEDLMAVVTSFTAPWSLAKGMVYDVECRDAKTGDAAFLAVSPVLADNISSLKDLKDDQVFLSSVFGPRGRFSFYGIPTDVKIKKSTLSEDGAYKILEVNFSTLSQATQTEVPRKSKIVATLPQGSKQVVMLVGSASATRWTQAGSDKTITATINSFRATTAPTTNRKLRPATNGRSIYDNDEAV